MTDRATLEKAMREAELAALQRDRIAAMLDAILALLKAN